MSDRVTVKRYRGGIGLCSVVFLIFLTLKLCGVSEVAGWSWWWVTVPLWGPWALLIGIFAVIFLGLGIWALVAR